MFHRFPLPSLLNDRNEFDENWSVALEDRYQDSAMHTPNDRCADSKLAVADDFKTYNTISS